MGSCLSAAKQLQAEAFLAVPAGSVAEDKAFRAMFRRGHNMCMRNFVSVTFPRAHLRGALAESMYERAVADVPGSVPAVRSPEEIHSIEDFARCYIAGHMNETRALLDETRLGTSEERDSVRSMAGDFGPCLPAGKKVSLVAQDVRFALAEAMYHATRGTAAQLAQGSN